MCSLKKCSTCGVEKSLTFFPKRKDSKDGYRDQCKDCKNAVNRAYKDRHRDELNRKQREVYSKTYRNKNRERVLERERIRDKNRRSYKTEQFRKWRHANPEKALATMRKHAHKSRDWALVNREYVRELQRNWRKRNPDKMREHYAKRGKHVKESTPKWLTKEQKAKIASFYKSARTMSVFHEIEFHVDHIEPLRGKFSCGLHVPWNLQILPASENLQKSNKIL